MEAVHTWLDESLGRFNGPLPAEERVQLDAQLVAFQKSSDAFLFSIEALKVSTSPMVLHFSASTIERVVSSRWAALGDEVKQSTRDCLLRFISNRGQEVPAFVLSKAAKAFVLIGKNDWPHAYPSFLGDITAMTHNADTTVVLSALTILRLVGEEFVSQSPTVRALRQDELRSLLTAELPGVLSLLKQLIVRDASSSSSVVTGAALENLAAYMGWMPIEQYINHEIITILFTVIRQHGSNSLHALSCILELLVRKYAPTSCATMLAQVFIEVSGMLEAASRTADSETHQQFCLNLDKICTLLISQHMWRIDIEPERYPALNTFLEPLVQYSFTQRPPISFMSTLEIWETFLDHLAESESAKSEHLADGLVGLAGHLLGVISIDSPMTMLHLADNTEQDLNGDTQQSTLISHTICIITGVSHLYPQIMIPKLAECFVPKAAVFQSYIKERLSLDQSKIEQMTKISIDLTTTVHLLYNMVIHFDSQWIDENGKEVAQGYSSACSSRDAVQLVNTVLELVNVLVQSALHKVSPAFLDLTKQSIAFLRASSSWLGECLHQPSAKPYIEQLLMGIMSISIRCLEPQVFTPHLYISRSQHEYDTLCTQVDQVLQKDAAALLEQNAGVIRIQQLISHPDCASFAQNIHLRCAKLPLEIQSQIYVAFLTSMLQSRSQSQGFVSARSKSVTEGDGEMQACAIVCCPLLSDSTWSYHVSYLLSEAFRI